MSKNIVICCDGTGNRGGVTRGTNVWRIFNAVDHHGCNPQQVVFYDDGVGTEGSRLMRILGGVFGWGLSRNIREAYAFLAMNFEPGDKVFLFGFSRGAFTVRSLAGLIGHCGLIRKMQLIDAGSHRCRNKLLKRLLHAYRSTRSVPNCPGQKICIQFIGVWDTVDAVGMPIDELKCVPELVMGFCGRRAWGFNDRKLHPCVRHAYHALALDEERKTFLPNIWDPDPERIEQVWFAGVHSNVGGGYPKDSLSFVSLDWMMGKAGRYGLMFKHGERSRIQQQANAHGRMYDSRAGIGMFYRFGRRHPCLRPPQPLPKNTPSGKRCWQAVKAWFQELIGRERTESCPDRPLVHTSVVERIRRGSNRYAPKNLCCEYHVAYSDSGPYAKCCPGSQKSTSGSGGAESAEEG